MHSPPLFKFIGWSAARIKIVVKDNLGSSYEWEESKTVSNYLKIMS